MLRQTTTRRNLLSAWMLCFAVSFKKLQVSRGFVVVAPPPPRHCHGLILSTGTTPHRHHQWLLNAAAQVESSSSSSSFDTTASDQAASAASDDTTTPFFLDDMDDDDDDDAKKLKAATLYDVLHASPNATRAELKRNYVALARETHPDAMIGRNSTVVTDTNFTEIASAWRVLSDNRSRKKYDRELSAQEFTNEVEQLASDFADKVAPAAKHMVENWAFPFLERSVTTTMVSLSAAAEDLRDSSDLGHAVGAAFKAGQHANRVMDRMELVDKSKELHASAIHESHQAMDLKQNLTELIDRRLHLALETEHSAISSAEAMKLLDGLNQVDRVSLVDRALRNKHKLQYEIQSLEQAETDYYQAYDVEQTSSLELQSLKDILQETQTKAKNAIAQQEEARKALEEAQQLVIEARNELLEQSKQYEAVESQHKRTASDLEKKKTLLKKTQEKVRKQLKQKHDQKKQNENTTFAITTTGVEALQELEDLRRQEQRIILESTQKELLAERLFDESNKMYSEAQEMQNAKQPKEANGTSAP